MKKSTSFQTPTGRVLILSSVMILAGLTASARDPISLTIATDYPSYAAGDTVNLSVSAAYSDGSPVTNVNKTQIEIKDGAGRRQVKDRLVDRGNGTFTYSYLIGASPRTGSWKAKVKVEDTSHNKRSQEAEFAVTDGGPQCSDADGDGFTDATCGGDDCDDGDPTVFPGATEICDDGVDNDCDGQIDEDCEPDCPDADGDGFTDAACGGDDCDDNDPTVFPGATEICDDGVDNDCDSQIDEDCEPDCLDADGDSFNDSTCGGDDCDDGDPTVFPGATEVCGDGIDQSCSGFDLPCGATHETLTWSGPGTCLQCHTDMAAEVHDTTHYQWKGETPYMTNGSSPQGKIAGGVNSYCINILGNWNVCGSCHVGRGAPPAEAASTQEFENIDCMVCHQKEYKRTKVDGVFVPDEAAMTISIDQAVQTVHMPERSNCLPCHAKAGGGDAVKRGDLALAHVATSDFGFDVHMATTGADLDCQACHTFTNHKVAGKGSDIRPTDSDVILDCTNCHAGKAQPGGHDTSDLDRHTARVACQTCHVPTYAKDASDTAATEATETHRTWLGSHSTAAPFHPAALKANDLTPRYRFWNRYSDNYLLHDTAQVDPDTGRYPTSRPEGDVGDPESKLYPFKYKTAEQPIMNSNGKLIALDTSVFFATGDAAAATEQGLVNMGHSATEPYSWIETDTFQLLNHQVSPSTQALSCNQCHGSTTRMDLQGELGYGLKGPRSVVCFQCHGDKGNKDFDALHGKHVNDKQYDCSWCHGFSRPERGLRMP